MVDLTSDEKTVLLIAAKGEPMIPIARWKVPTESLVKKGFMKPRPHPGDPTGYFNHHITPEGMKAVEEAEKDDDELLRQLITKSNSVGHAHKKARAAAEQIAVQMVDLVEESVKVTGDDKVHALREWARVILERALEVMK